MENMRYLLDLAILLFAAKLFSVGGKKIGIILNELLETVLEDPAMNDKEKLLKIAGNLNSLY